MHGASRIRLSGATFMVQWYNQKDQKEQNAKRFLEIVPLWTRPV
jgi:hypothetical protein